MNLYEKAQLKDLGYTPDEIQAEESKPVNQECPACGSNDKSLEYISGGGTTADKVEITCLSCRFKWSSFSPMVSKA